MSLLLPTDACPQCVAGPVHPYHVIPVDEVGAVVALYECPARHRWTTAWDESAMNLPCPGCPDCNPERRTA